MRFQPVPAFDLLCSLRLSFLVLSLKWEVATFLPTWTLRCHCRVTDCPYFCDVASQGGLAFKREGDRKQPGSGAVKTDKILSVKFTALYEHSSWHPQFNYNRSHPSEFIRTGRVIMKSFETLWELPKCDTEAWGEYLVFPPKSTDNFLTQVAADLQLVKNSICEAQ